jgi:hypothetical protein
LKKVKRGNTVAVGGDGLSDDGKIRVQIGIDVKAFGREIDGFGVTCEGYSKLVKAVEDDEMIVIE